MTAGPLPPPGWHADPSGRHQLRYWDGTRWSEHVADAGVVGTDDLTAPPSPVAQPEPRVAPTPAVGLGEPPPSVPAAADGVLDPGTAAWPASAPPGAAPAMMRRIGGLAASLTVVLWVTVASAVLGALAYANRVVVAGDILDFDFGGGGFQEALDLQRRSDDADDFVTAAALIMIVCSLAVFVLLLVWMWRVAKNAELAGRARPRFAPGWTIGGWFIPLANLVIPVLVMQDLWRGSDPSVARGDPDWRRAAGSGLVGWWWATHLVAAIRFGGGGEADSRSELERLRGFDAAASVGMLVAIAAAILLILVVRRITRRQESLFAGRPVTTV